jgi:hypothetical protein
MYNGYGDSGLFVALQDTRVLHLAIHCYAYLSLFDFVRISSNAPAS